MKIVLNGKTILPNIYTDGTGSTNTVRVVKLYGISYNNEASYYDTVFMYIPTFTTTSSSNVKFKFNNVTAGEVPLDGSRMEANKMYFIQLYEGTQYTGGDGTTLSKLHAKAISLSGSGGSPSSSSIIYVSMNQNLIIDNLDTAMYVSNDSAFSVKTNAASQYTSLSTLDGRFVVVAKYADISDGEVFAIYIDSNLNVVYMSKDVNDLKGWTATSVLYSGTVNFGANNPQCSATPSNNNHLVNKAYVDGLVGDINEVLDELNGEVI